MQGRDGLVQVGQAYAEGWRPGEAPQGCGAWVLCTVSVSGLENFPRAPAQILRAVEGRKACAALGEEGPRRCLLSPILPGHLPLLGYHWDSPTQTSPGLALSLSPCCFLTISRSLVLGSCFSHLCCGCAASGPRPPVGAPPPSRVRSAFPWACALASSGLGSRGPNPVAVRWGPWVMGWLRATPFASANRTGFCRKVLRMEACCWMYHDSSGHHRDPG